MLLLVSSSLQSSRTAITPKKAGGYLPQLDSVRALAVGLVVLSHYWEGLNKLYFFSGRTGVL